MKALGGSCSNFFLSRHTESVGLHFCLCKHDFRFLLNQKRLGDGLVSFRTTCLPSISTPLSAQSGLEREEIQTVSSDQPKTVRVRFKLHKQCAFGQEFVVVGDDPSLGLWDPSNGVHLNWSEGHVWTAEVDILSGKVISYKFVLKEITGTVSWQPDPDRVLETWDTANIISVTEDWEFPEFQIIHEEEAVYDLNEAFLNDSDLLIAENLNQIVKEEEDDAVEERVDVNERTTDQSDKPSTVMVAENITVEDLGLMNVDDLLIAENLNQIVKEEEDDAVEERVDVNERTTDRSDKPSTVMVAENITVEDLGLMNVDDLLIAENLNQIVKEEEDDALEERVDGNERTTDQTDKPSTVMVAENITVEDLGLMSVADDDDGSKPSSLEKETELVMDEGVPVLVPGLATMLPEETEAEETETEASSIVGSSTTTVSDDKIVAESDEIEVSNHTIVEDATTESDQTEGATEPEVITSQNTHIANSPVQNGHLQLCVDGVCAQIRAPASIDYAETSEVMAVKEDEERSDGREKMERNILGRDMQWGRQTLHKFLATLGFMQHG